MGWLLLALNCLMFAINFSFLMVSGPAGWFYAFICIINIVGVCYSVLVIEGNH